MTKRIGEWIGSVLPEWFTPRVALGVIIVCGFLLLAGGL
jgi:hypothetical protein